MQKKVKNPLKKRLNPILSSRDKNLMLFLWKYRITTFRALKEIFYPEKTFFQAYYEMRRLRRGEYLCVERLEGTKNIVWMLGSRGFKYLVANLLPELRSKGFRPQSQYHDLLATAALVGHWCREVPENVKVVSEQELRSLDHELVPGELKERDIHKPDGIWIFSDGKKTKAVALEVEISAKTSDRYEQTCAFYASEGFFESVVWIVKSKPLGQRILDASSRYGQTREGLNLFILQQEFEKHGWDSQFLNKSMGEASLGEFLNRLAGVRIERNNQYRINVESTLNQPGNPRDKTDPLLDFRVSFENLGTLQKIKTLKNA